MHLICEPLACFRAHLVCRRWCFVKDKMDKKSRWGPW
uniref:Uncharacterized protein n=1 Tax=Onchocerca volvulus TaxID=6282 RepID=A0A8R1TUR5_ONCVO